MANIYRLGESTPIYSQPGMGLKETIEHGIAMGVIDLRYADLQGCDLSGINFGHKDLTGADLSSTNLQNTKFYHAIMHNVDM